MSRNVRHLCRLETPGGGQVVLQGKYGLKNPQGKTITDIADSPMPKIVGAIDVTMILAQLALTSRLRYAFAPSASAVAHKLNRNR